MENEDFTLDFMGYKAMCHCRPIIQRLHNKRDPKIVSSEKHIDPLRLHETILDCGTLENCYEQIFGEAVKKYNAKQKRKDRRIENYLETILNDKRQGKHKNIKADGRRKSAYEMILQLGNISNRPDDKIASRVLKDFCNFLIENYPNIVPIGIYLHNDEFSIDEETHQKVFSPVHIHFDYVYVAHLGKSLKTGMELQCSMSGALAEMGFVTAKGKGTAQQQFEESVRHDLQDFAEERGLKIDRTPGERHKHLEKPVFQQKMENLKKEKRLREQEVQIENTQKELSQNIVNYNNAALELNAEIKNVKQEKIELIRKEREYKLREEQQRKKEHELNMQKYELMQREVNAKMKEGNLEFQKQTNESKSLELSKREKALENAETPLKEKEKALTEQQAKLEETAKDGDAKLGQLQILQKENEEKTKSLEVMEKELEVAKQDFESSNLKIQAYKEIQNQVENNNLAIDSEINEFQKNRSIDFSTCLNKFVGNVKKIVTAVTTELSWYKAAFKTFWKKRSQDFRKLADLMDRNSCETFSDYNRMYYNGQLDYQLEERKSKKKNNSMDFER